MSGFKLQREWNGLFFMALLGLCLCSYVKATSSIEHVQKLDYSSYSDVYYSENEFSTDGNVDLDYAYTRASSEQSKGDGAHRNGEDACLALRVQIQASLDDSRLRFYESLQTLQEEFFIAWEEVSASFSQGVSIVETGVRLIVSVVDTFIPWLHIGHFVGILFPSWILDSMTDDGNDLYSALWNLASCFVKVCILSTEPMLKLGSAFFDLGLCGARFALSSAAAIGLDVLGFILAKVGLSISTLPSFAWYYPLVVATSSISFVFVFLIRKNIAKIISKTLNLFNFIGRTTSTAASGIVDSATIQSMSISETMSSTGLRESVMFDLVGIHVLSTSPLKQMEFEKTTSDESKVIGVYVHRYDKDTSIYRQIEFSGDDVRKKIAFEHWAFNCGVISKSRSTVNKNAMANDEISQMKFQLPADIESYRRLSMVPFLDIYGKIHPSYGAYMCSQVDINFSLLAPHIKGHIEHVRSPSTMSSTMPIQSDDVEPMNVLMCDDEHICRLRAMGGTIRKIEDADAAHPDKVVDNTKLFTAMMGMSGYDPSVKTMMEHSYGNPNELVFLMEQLSPENDTTFRYFKAAYGWYAKLKAMMPASISPPADITADPSQSMSLNDFIGETNIRFSKPIEYHELCRVAKPGDMIAVHGFQSLSSIICTIQSKIRGGSKFMSHVGMLIDTTIVCAPGMIEGELYLLESCVGGGILGNLNDVVPDVYGLARHGVQIRSMRSLLKQSAEQKTIYLHCPLNSVARWKFDQCVGLKRRNVGEPCKIASCIQKYASRSYTTNPANFFLGIGSGSPASSSPSNAKLTSILTQYSIKNSSAFGNEFYCSELVASLYIEVGILETKYKGEFWGMRPDEVDVAVLEDMHRNFYFPRQVFPIDFFRKDSLIPYLFGDVRVVQPTQTILA